MLELGRKLHNFIFSQKILRWTRCGIWDVISEMAVNEICSNMHPTPQITQPLIIIRENSFTVAPAEVVKILAHTLGEYDSIGLLGQRLFSWPRISACHYEVNMSIDTWMEREDHGLKPLFD
jgi:hypothetical protein